MLRMLSRAHCSHTHLVRPRSIPADHPSGGGSEGECVPHRWHTTSGTARAYCRSPLPECRSPAGLKQSDPPEMLGRV